MNHDTPGPLYWHERGNVMRFSQGEARAMPLNEADALLAFYRNEGPKTDDEAARYYMARCFAELHDAVGAVRRAAA